MFDGKIGTIRQYLSDENSYIVDIFNGPKGGTARAVQPCGIFTPYPSGSQVVLQRYNTTTWVILGELPRPNTTGESPPTDATDAAISSILKLALDQNVLPPEVASYRTLKRLLQPGDIFLGDNDTHVHKLRNGSLIMRAGASALRFFSAPGRTITDVCRKFGILTPGVTFNAGVEDPDITEPLNSFKRPIPFFRFTHSSKPKDVTDATKTTVQSFETGGVDITVGLFIKMLADALAGKIQFDSLPGELADSENFNIIDALNGLNINPTGISLERKLSELGFSVRITDAGIQLAAGETGITITPVGVTLNSPLLTRGGDVSAVDPATGAITRTVSASLLEQIDGETRNSVENASANILKAETAGGNISKTEKAPIITKLIDGQLVLTLNIPTGAAPIVVINTADGQPASIRGDIDVLGKLTVGKVPVKLEGTP